MRQTLSGALRHVLLAVLLGAGMLLSIFTVYGLQNQLPGALGILILTVAFCTLASVRKSVFAVLSCVLAVLLGIWLVQSQGAQILFDTFIAIMYTLTGVRGALPLYARETGILLSIVLSLIAYFSAGETDGGFSAWFYVGFLLFLSWIENQPVLLVTMIPTVIAAIIMTTAHADLSWSHLRATVPLALVLSVLAFLLVPRAGITVQPFKDAADSIRQRVQDYLFYTEPRSVFSLASEGYYPNGSSTLGGTATPDDHLVMVVKTPVSVYLRGNAKNEYTGRSWNDTTGGRRYLWVSPRWLSLRSEVFNQDLPDASFSDSPLLQPRSISVQMVSSSASDLFVPQRVQGLVCSGDMIPYFNQASEIFATRDLVSGDSWTVQAPTPVLGDPGLQELIALCEAQGDDPEYAGICELYTRLPSHLSSQLFDLARSITSGEQTVYGKVQAIAEYLKTHYQYSLQVEPVPDNVDFVSFFLLQTHEGYCTYFATAAAVLCRMVGIPARYVEGFHVIPASSGTTYVTGVNGHAWTEVYFPGFGWLTVEATPGEGNGSSSGSSSADPSSSSKPSASPAPSSAPTPTPSATPTPTVQEPAASSPSPSPAPEDSSPAPSPEASPDAPGPDQSDADGPSSAWIWLLLLLAVSAVSLRVFFTLPSQRARRQKGSKGIWLVWMQEIDDILHIQRCTRFSWETPSAYFERLDTEHRLASPLSPLCDCAAAVFYGHELPVEEDIQLYSQTAADLYSQLSWWKKLKLLVYRAIPRKPAF